MKCTRDKFFEICILSSIFIYKKIFFRKYENHSYLELLHETIIMEMRSSVKEQQINFTYLIDLRSLGVLSFWRDICDPRFLS